MEKITRLERELKEAQDKIDRICKWITEEYGIIIPEFILNPAAVASDSDPEDTYTFNRKIEPDQVQGGVTLKSELYDENNDYSSTLGVEDHLYCDFDENEYIEKIPTSSCKLSSKNAIKVKICKPCYVLLPPRIDHQSHVNVAQIIPAPPVVQLQLQLQKKVKTKPTIGHKENHAKSRKRKHWHWRERLKKRPTEDEKISVLNMYKTLTNFLDINCPICSVSIKSIKNCRSQFKLHLMRMHYFDEKELDVLIPSFRKRNRGPKIQLTEGQKLQVLQSLQNYSDSGDNDNSGALACPACPNKKFSHDGQIMRLKYRFKSHLKTVHMFTHHDFNMFKGVTDQKSKSSQNHSVSESDDGLNVSLLKFSNNSTSEVIELQSQEPKEKHYSINRNLLTEGQKLQALQSLQDHTDGKLLSIVCPACPNKKFSHDGQIMRLKYRFKSHLKTVHMFTHHDFNMFKAVQDQKSKSSQNHPESDNGPNVSLYNFANTSEVIEEIPELQKPDETKSWNYAKSRKLRQHWRERLKKRPTEYEKISALDLYKSSASFLNVKCPICSANIINNQDLRQSFKLHLIRMHYFDEKEFNNIPRENRRESGHSKKALLCTVCGKTFAHSNYLKIHSLRAHSSSKPTFQCDICSSLFHFKGDLNLHKSSHLTEKNYICQVCGSAFKKLPHLSRHLQIHSEDRREFKCLVENCGKTFITNEGLQSHTKILHIGQVKKYHCDKCNLAFFRSYNLLQHRQAVHEHVRPFKCTICPSAFKTKTHLKYHINTHSNPKAKKRGYNKPKDL